MKTISFGKDQSEAFYKALQKRVNAYLETKPNQRWANAGFWLKLLFYYAGFILSFTSILGLDNSNTGQLFLLYLLCGCFVLGIIFNVAHDAAHETVFRKKKYNRWLYNLSFPLLGNHPYVWRKYHIQSHHLFTNVEGSDIDVITTPLIRLNENEPARPYHRYQQLYAPFIYLFYTINFIFLRDLRWVFGKTDRTIEIKVPLRAVVGYVFSKAFYFGLFIFLPAFITGIPVWKILLAFLAMQGLMSVIIILVLSCNHQVDLTAHYHHQEMEKQPLSWVTLQLQANLDYSTRSRFFHFIVGGFNAHTLHHLFPAVCHVHYRELVTIMRETCSEYQVHYNETGYANALRSHFRFLRKMGRA